jgi:hypothetical protein
MADQLTNLSSQRGASVTSTLLLLILIVIAGKLLLAIVPAQVGDYQLTKALSEQLQVSNNKGETAKQFIARLDRQLSINAYYDIKAAEVLTFTNKKPGQLAIYKKYHKTNNFFANVDIVNRFAGEIK